MASRSAKYWREASTLILAARIPKSATPATHSTVLPRIKLPPADYNLLMLKRSKHSRFLPEVHVFPGGVASDIDFTAQWDDVFRSVSGQTLTDVGSELACSGPRPPCIQEENPGMPSDVAFRICAIRETFEESGILLAMNSNQLKERREKKNTKACVVDYNLLRDWRTQVEKDENNFLKLCWELQVVPDVWALTEWCNWLTPVMRPVSEAPKKPTRYDTMFYLSCFDGEGMPYSEPDNQETFSPEWYMPPEYIGYSSSELRIFGPQLLELGRLCQIPRLADLEVFAKERAKLGTERWMNHYVQCKDGVVVALPGDDLIPAELDYEGTSGKWPKVVDATLQELTDGVERLNRVFRGEHPSDKSHDHRPFLCTVKQKYGHLTPLTRDGLITPSLVW
ncbi:hypothetical protein CAPTEDRAFT_184265 [Capitella teleta]|uniref:Nudix hydrolase domain-containing protein n=1 Tax=Capitella teleta TaxID=283909 RepID=X1ZGX4_CAPTE|nr:hypothetical protein CAPTEDRAFT_184265 [Capitella teleta]|eukprot:ELU00325.1 hypothetical protein CAPTEDRAFT_184265 [Capitella teleta]